MTLEVKNLDNPDEKRSFEHGDVRLVKLSGMTIARAEFNPGWEWVTDVAPLVGTDSCQATHTSYVVSGRLHVRMDDGREAELGPGDAHIVGPGHNAWVVGDEACITVDFIAGRAGTMPWARMVACPCGVEFRVNSVDALDHLVGAVREHMRGSHGKDATREHILAEVQAG